MPWTCARLEAEWIGSPIEILGDSATSALRAFDCVEKHLGVDWLAARRLHGWGPGPTLDVVLLGECLAGVDTLHGFEILLDKVRTGDDSGLSEMEAIRMFRRMGDLEIELAPELLVGTAKKKPDFRVRRSGERWTYVEVTKPDTSDAAAAAQKLLQRLQDVMRVRREFSMEIFLRREPTMTEEKAILTAAIGLADSDAFETLDLPKLALITKQLFTGPIVTPINHPGEDNTVARLGAATGVVSSDGTEPQRLISVRMPFTDERADAFLKREAKQLSKDERGLIMVDMKNAHSGMKRWDLLIRRRLQPDVHTRVGAVCLFTSGLELGRTGVQLLFDFKTIENPHATQPLPQWILDEIRKMAAADDAKRTARNGAES
jgi:hypothetical protein